MGYTNTLTPALLTNTTLTYNRDFHIAFGPGFPSQRLLASTFRISLTVRRSEH